MVSVIQTDRCLWLQITGGLVCEKWWYPKGQIGGDCSHQDNNPSQVIESKVPFLRLLFISCFAGDKISPTPTWPPRGIIRLVHLTVFWYQINGGVSLLTLSQARHTLCVPRLSTFISFPKLVLGHLALKAFLPLLGSIEGILRWRHQTDICHAYNWPLYSPGFQKRMIRGWKYENGLGRGGENAISTLPISLCLLRGKCFSPLMFLYIRSQRSFCS